MDKKYILTIAISVIFAGLIGFYSGRFYEVHTARKKFMNMRGGNGTFQGQRPQGQGFRQNGGQAPQGMNAQPVSTTPAN